eukprot:COSAG02_NODE_27231_length_614_cov_0.959223_2_plen_68_part_01
MCTDGGGGAVAGGPACTVCLYYCGRSGEYSRIFLIFIRYPMHDIDDIKSTYSVYNDTRRPVHAHAPFH